MNESNESSSSTPDSWCRTIGEYAFHQQHSANCIIFPMLNRALADKLIENNYYFSSFRTRKDWVGLNLPYEIAWRQMLQQLNDKNCPPEYEALKAFLNNICLRGPQVPAIYTDAQKTLPLSMHENHIDVVSEKSIILHTTSQANDFRDAALEYAAIPYFFADITTSQHWKNDNASLLKQALATTIIKETQYTFKAPCGITPDDDLEFFNNTTGQYEKIHLHKTNYGWCVQNQAIHADIARQDSSTFYDGSSLIPLLTALGMHVPQNAMLTFVLRSEKMDFGSWRYAGIFDSDCDGFWASNGHLYAPYALGYYKLMLLRLGLDENNNVLVENGEVLEAEATSKNIDVMIALQKLSNQNSFNPWNDVFFKKETFLQYALADILKHDQELTLCAEITVDFFWRTYTGYDTFMDGYFYNADGARMSRKNMAHVMPGKEQILAYAITQNLRYLWYGAQSLRAFCDTILEIGTIQGPHKKEDAKSMWEMFKAGAFAKKEGFSFMDVWSQLHTKLLLHPQYKNVTNWTSFDDHGWVASFDPTLIAMQNALPVNDNEVLNSLGLAVIDSWQNEKSNVFYKRSVPFFQSTAKIKVDSVSVR